MVPRNEFLRRFCMSMAMLIAIITLTLLAGCSKMEEAPKESIQEVVDTIKPPEVDTVEVDTMEGDIVEGDTVEDDIVLSRDDDTSADKETPAPLPEKNKDITVFYNKTIALHEEGAVVYYIDNLGDLYCITGKPEDKKPVFVTSNVKSVYTRSSGTLIIKNDNSLWVSKGIASYTHGGNFQLGEEVDGFYKLLDDVRMAAIAGLGGNYFFAVKNDDSLWCWGYNNGYRAFGVGNVNEAPSSFSNSRFCEPQKLMDGVRYVTTVYPPDARTFIIKTDDSLWGWGSNDSNKISPQDERDFYTPVKIMDDVATVSAGYYHTLALKKNGTLWGWGNNRYGNVTAEDESRIAEPLLLSEDIVFIYAESSTGSLAVRSDGSLLGWGRTDALDMKKRSQSEYIATTLSEDSAPIAAIGSYSILMVNEAGELWYQGSTTLVKYFDDVPRDNDFIRFKIADNVRLPNND